MVIMNYIYIYTHTHQSTVEKVLLGEVFIRGSYGLLSDNLTIV